MKVIDLFKKYWNAVIGILATLSLLYPAAKLTGSLSIYQWIGLASVFGFSVFLYFCLYKNILKGAFLTNVLVIFAYAVTAFVSFYPTIGNIFRGDDWTILFFLNGIDGISLRTLQDISFFEMFGHMRFQPLAHLIIFLRHLIFGNNVALYHVLNMLLHAATGFLIYLAVRALNEETPLAFLLGLLFITLPIIYTLSSEQLPRF